MRHRRLQGVKAIIEQQQHVLPEGDDDPLLGEQRAPSNSNVVALGQPPQAHLTTLYHSTDRLGSWGCREELGPKVHPKYREKIVHHQSL
jgi:hypothetical protein